MAISSDSGRTTTIVTSRGGVGIVTSTSGVSRSPLKPTFTSEGIQDRTSLSRLLTQMVEWIEKTIAPAASSPRNGAVIFKNLSMTAGATTRIRHLLSRPFVGYTCIRAQGSAFSAFEASLSVNIASSTNASPIVVTTSSAHNLTSADRVRISGHVTNTAANGDWAIVVTGATTFSLNGSTGNGVGGATGKSLIIDYDISRDLLLRSNNTGTYDIEVF